MLPLRLFLALCKGPCAKLFECLLFSECSNQHLNIWGSHICPHKIRLNKIKSIVYSKITCVHLQGSSKQYRTDKETLVNMVIGLALLPPQGISDCWNFLSTMARSVNAHRLLAYYKKKLNGPVDTFRDLSIQEKDKNQSTKHLINKTHRPKGE